MVLVAKGRLQQSCRRPFCRGHGLAGSCQLAGSAIAFLNRWVCWEQVVSISRFHAGLGNHLDRCFCPLRMPLRPQALRAIPTPVLSQCHGLIHPVSQPIHRLLLLGRVLHVLPPGSAPAVCISSRIYQQHIHHRERLVGLRGRVADQILGPLQVACINCCSDSDHEWRLDGFFQAAVYARILVVLPQILQALGGGTLVMTMQMAVMAVAKHGEIASLIALLGLSSTVGSGIGSSVSGAIWTNTAYAELLRLLPDDAKDQATEIYEDL